MQFPRAPRPSRATLLRAIPSLGVVSVSLVGLLAVPAGSPPPPPAVTATPIPPEQPTDTPTVEPVTQPAPSEVTQNDPPLPRCYPRGHSISTKPARGTVVYANHTSSESLVLYDPATGAKTVVLTGKGSCGFYKPSFTDDHTITYEYSSAYIMDNGDFRLDLLTGKISRLTGSRRDWSWLAGSALSPDGSHLAELGTLDQSESFLLRVMTKRGSILFSRSMGYVCYCDGIATPIEVRWSADGAYLLVAVPGQNSNELFFIDLKGNVRTMFVGGFPRWIGTTHAFIYQDAKGRWLRVDTLTGTPRAFLNSGSTLADPALSPDLSRIAFWDTTKFDIAVYDFGTETLKHVGQFQVYPIWLDDQTIASTGVKRCVCEGYGFELTGTGWSTTLRTGGTHRVPVNSIEADVLR